MGITGRLMHADGQEEEVLVLGEEVREELTGQAVEGTDWRKGAKDEWEAKERAVVRGNWLRSVDRDCVYDRGRPADGIGKRGALAAPCCC